MLLKNLTITDLAMLLQKEVFEEAEEKDLSEEEFEFIQYKCDRYVYDLLDAKIEIDDKLADLFGLEERVLLLGLYVVIYTKKKKKKLIELIRKLYY